MKIKNLLVLILGIISLFGPIALEKLSAMPLSVTSKTPAALVAQSRLTVDGLEARSQQLYEMGRFKDAIALLQQLESDYASQNDRLGQARVLRNLSLVYQEMGELSNANEAITSSFNFIQKLSNNSEKTLILARVLEVQGLLQLSSGKAELALATWKQAAQNYEQVGDRTGIERSQINQATALQRLGLYREAIKTLERVNDNLQQQPDTLLKVKGLQSLGNALRVTGELERSQTVLSQSLATAEKLSDAEAIASTLLSLGNTVRLQDKPQIALFYYQKSAQTSISPNLKLQAKVNQVKILVEQKEWSLALELVPQINSILTQLHPSRIAINAKINLARNLMIIAAENPKLVSGDKQSAELLITAVEQAQILEDKRSLAYAWGNLGRLYEQNKQWKYARELTERALLLAQSINASDIAYRWEWQLGRILKQQGDRKGAIAAYTEAVNALQSIRSDLAAITSEAQFSFRDTVEPIYRELVDLLLPPREKIEQPALKKAREVIELLQLAELDNFFRDACLNTQPVQIDEIDPKAAIFSTIILSDRLEVIVALPGQPLRRHTAILPQTEIEATVTQARDAILIPRLRFSPKKFLAPSQKIYDWLIRPIEAELASSGVQTLVFVLDGLLRNLPMTALYDGEKYLVQKYGITLAPGLQLVDANPLARAKLQVLTAGLSEARQGFSPLPGVTVELENISAEVNTEKLLNQTFTSLNFATKVKSNTFPIVHLATHGQFSSKASDTFILTWDNKINVKEFDSLLRSDTRTNRPIELLVLSACQTATGDNRATLGLTGVAVRAGARSTVASLWSVSDEATSLLMTKFYQELANGEVTKAEALRRAEQAVLQNNQFYHPYFWSAFVLVGNWL